MKKVCKGIALVLVMALATIGIASAQEWIYTSVLFNVEADLGFQVTLPSAPAPNMSAPYPGNSTEDIWFNASTPNDKQVQPCRVGGSDCQDSTTPIYLVRSLGSVQMNLSIGWSTTPNAAYLVFANVSNATTMVGCTGWTLGTDESVIPTRPDVFNFTQGMCPNNETNLFLMSNFTSAPAGENSYILNISSDTYN